MDIQELAEYANSFFTTMQAQRGEKQKTINILVDRYPSWIYEMVYKAHEEMLPDDYKYEYIVETLDALSEGQDPEEGLNDLEADVYDSDLLEWLSSHGERQGFVNEAVEVYGHSKEMGIMGDIMMGQKSEKEQVWRIVVEALKERLEDIEIQMPEEFMSRGKREEREKPIRRWRPKKK